MKKNININLAGIIFCIDEDAYELLKQYTDTLRRHYSRSAEGTEVVDDIEARIAELFGELKAQGHEAINIGDVQNIIHRIGEVDEIAEEDGEGKSTSEGARNNQQDDAQYNSSYTTGESLGDTLGRQSRTYWESFKSRRFYRDPSDKKLAGVLSGCAAYFGGNLLWWRIGYILALLFTNNICWIFLLAYLLLAILAPEANTPEAQLRMRGREVNPQNLADEVTAHSVNGNSSGGSAVWKVLMAILFVLVGLPAIFWAILFCILTLTLACIPSMFFAFLPTLNMSGIDAGLINMLSNHLHMPWAVSLAVTLGIGIVAYCCVHGLCSTLGATKPMGIRQRIVWIVLFLGCLAFTYIGVSRTVAGVTVEMLQIEQQEKEEYRKTHSRHYGKEFRNIDWEFFKAEGWRLIDHEGCDDHRVTTVGQHYSGIDSLRYLDVYNRWAEHKFTAERSQQVEPGRYRLTCITRAEDTGAYVYLREGASIRQPECQHMETADILHFGNTEGELWYWATGAMKAEDARIPASMQADEHLRQQIADANDETGFGWGVTVIDNFAVFQPTTLFYGVSNNKNYFPNGEHAESQCVWFSATDFVLEKMQ